MPSPTGCTSCPEQVEALLAQAAALTRAQQHELLQKLHDALYHPVYSPAAK